MKVVLLHDWLVGFRGGERVLEVFCEMFPEAPLYTLIYKKGSTSKIIEDRKIETSFLNKIPRIYKHYRKALPFFPLAADMLKIKEEADLVISSSHCVIKGVRKPKGAKHFSYVHSPMRYIYDLFDDYFGKDAPLIQQIGAKVCRGYLQNWDIKSNDNVDLMVGNSCFVKQRIKKYYGIDSKVIHPFVDLVDFRALQKEAKEKDNFYLIVSAFAPNKKIDLAVRAFNELNLSLKIVGSGQQEKYLKSIAGPNIEFLGNASREEVINLFSKAKAFIFPGVEDFGITPLESLASGTPVIARRIGGVLETLNNDVAEFFEADSKEELMEAVKRFELRKFSRDDLFNRAEEFSKAIFKRKIESQISELMK